MGTDTGTGTGAPGITGDTGSTGATAATGSCTAGLAPFHMLGVFDGHRGFEAADFCATELPDMLLQKLAEMSPKDALKATFLEADSALEAVLDARRSSRPDSSSSSISSAWFPGCTACVALVIGSELYVANAGDCRAVVRGGKGVRVLTQDHLASDPSERKRVQREGGFVQWRVNTWRVGKAGIEVTRSIGDHDLKPAVTAEPQITHCQLAPDDEFLVFASDGLWEKLTNEEAAQLVLDTVKEPFLSAKRLVSEAVDRGSRDNVTAVVAYLTPVSTAERIF